MKDEKEEKEGEEGDDEEEEERKREKSCHLLLVSSVQGALPVLTVME